jgi:hypothetical protein
MIMTVSFILIHAGDEHEKRANSGRKGVPFYVGADQELSHQENRFWQEAVPIQP